MTTKELLASPVPGSVATLGSFDGLHRGHQELIQQVVSKAKASAVLAVAVTYWPHPAEVLFPHKKLKRMFSKKDMIDKFSRMGLDLLVIEDFTQKFSQIEASDYLERYIFEALNPKELVVGKDFKIGRQGKGNLTFLKSYCKEKSISLNVVEPIKIKQSIISSTQIRNLIKEGSVDQVKLFLGEPFYLKGVVLRGHQKGRELGFPTANIVREDYLIPKNGVYITLVEFAGNQFQSVTNIGYRPTMSEGLQLVIETHLLDQSMDLYEKEIKVNFLKRLRDEEKFSSVQELVLQIKVDVNKASEYFLKYEMGCII